MPAAVGWLYDGFIYFGKVMADGKTEWSLRRVDAVLTAAVIAAGVGDSWIKGSNGVLLTGLPIWVVALQAAATGSVLWWRRAHPGPVAVIVMANYAIGFTPVAMGVAMYTAGAAYHRRPRALAAFAVVGCAAGVVGLRGGLPESDAREAVFALGFVLGPLVVGYAASVRRDLTEAVQAHVADLEREHHLLAEQARADERAGIAREMHDVLGHRVSAMVLTAGALLVGAGAQMEEVRSTAERIRRDGRQALEELREVLGVLAPRHPGQVPLAPQPDAAQLPVLAEQARELGQDVRLEVEGHPELLPVAVQRAVYRVVQESLTNAAKHAPGAPVHVAVACRTDGVHLSIANTAPTRPPSQELPSGGNGLIGLAERVDLLGGHLSAGPRGGGFAVTALIPHRTAQPAGAP
jgi:signal transduction histidine kinase